jgi:EAL domain-containing protein (putative c-di-GMP-specific phosphodiesterase class I)
MAIEGRETAGRMPWPSVGAYAAPGQAALGRDGGDAAAPLLTADLHAALADARIQTLYQPIVRLADRRPVGIEVLARLEHPAQGVLLPGRFIPPMEDAGLGCKLTKAVLQRAFGDWDGERLEALDLVLAFNFPLDVLLLPDALRHLDAVRMQAGVPAGRVVIELTESRPPADLTELCQATSWLRSIGYGIAIDDIGPDIRDHRTLLDLHFTALKLDKALVRDARDDPASREFLVHAIAAAAAAGMTVTAEGVEDEATWARMTALGVDLAQGYLVSHPLPAAEVLPWWREWCSRHAVSGQLRQRGATAG